MTQPTAWTSGEDNPQAIILGQNEELPNIGQSDLTDGQIVSVLI